MERTKVSQSPIFTNSDQLISIRVNDYYVYIVHLYNTLNRECTDTYQRNNVYNRCFVVHSGSADRQVAK